MTFPPPLSENPAYATVCEDVHLTSTWISM